MVSGTLRPDIAVAALTSASSTPSGRLRTKHDARAPRRRAPGDRVDRGGLQLGQVDVAALRRRALQVVAPAPRAARGSWTMSTGSDALDRGRAGGEERDARAVRSGSAGSGRSEKRSAPGRRVGAPRGRAGGRRAAAGTRRAARACPAPMTQTVRSTSTGGMHAPEPSNTIAPGVRATPPARRRPPRSSRTARPRARRPRAGSRPCARPRARRPRGSRRRRARRAPRSRAGRRATAPASATRGSAGPPRPMQTITGSTPASRSSAGPVPGDRGLAGALAGADHGQLRPVERDRLVARRRRAAAPGAS